MTLGQRVRERRNELGLTLKQVAQATDLSIAYLSDVERDRTRPSLKTLGKIAEGLKTTATDLMSGAEGFAPASDEALPEGLRALKDDEEYREEMSDEWVRTLLRVDYRGRRPQTKTEWLELHLFLRRILRDKQS